MHGARLTVDLDAITANYRLLTDRCAGATVAAVLKANAYGLGLAPVADALLSAGCACFFVAHFSEGAALRALAPNARIYILHGLAPGHAHRYVELNLRPVLNGLEEVETWRTTTGPRPGAILNFDTGMTRLGLCLDDARKLAADAALLEGVEIDYVMSHLACADTPQHDMNTRQLAEFRQLRQILPQFPATLANTGGALLPAEFHFDLVRAGIGLFGGNPQFDGNTAGSSDNPFRNVVRLEADILQVRDVDSANSVGYGATYRFSGPGRVAVLGIGYADGFMRALGNFGVGALGDHIVPAIGQVSMDLTAFDVTDVPSDACYAGATITLIGDQVPLERIAAAAGTLSYEILTRLGDRLARSYVSRSEESA